MKRNLMMGLAAAFALAAGAADSNRNETDVNPRLSPDEVSNQQALDREANPLYESQLLAPVAGARNCDS